MTIRLRLITSFSRNIFLELPAVGKLFAFMAGSHDVKGAGLFRIDDLLDSTVDRVHVIVVTDARSGVFPAHPDIAMPFRVPGCVKA